MSTATDTAPAPAPVKMEQEQAADLAALHASAAEEPALPGAAEEVAAPNLAMEIEGLTLAIVSMLSPVFPSLPGIYTPDSTKTAAAAVAVVCQKHGWLEVGMMGNFGEEFACLAVVGPLAFATYVGVKSDLAKREASKPAKPIDNLTGPDLSAAPATATPGQSTVSFGAPSA